MAADVEWNVFFADDDEDDAFLFEMAVKMTHPNCVVRRFTNLATLSNAFDQTRLTTSIIFLDLTTRPVSGMDLLVQIRQIGRLSSIMIFMFTGSQDPKMISLAYQHQVDCYLFKPASHDEWVQVLSHAIRFAKNI
ncbi:response regulator [Dyadobacter sp. 50-39]|uniref:response regulator n=1 Tax=Dyadobacter sp. 50-39 TaxID=1895756 RepID=UPI0025BEE599|nr:response regulator [Dyadobacter sp. 50-39]